LTQHMVTIEVVIRDGKRVQKCPIQIGKNHIDAQRCIHILGNKKIDKQFWYFGIGHDCLRGSGGKRLRCMTIERLLSFCENPHYFCDDLDQEALLRVRAFGYALHKAVHDGTMPNKSGSHFSVSVPQATDNDDTFDHLGNRFTVRYPTP
jgi:hypothetical protein